ncbi:MAG: arylsulfatase [Alteromonadaceae bacterium]|nr:arylsulfatase [Alteromonadaceae bacterium]
MFNTKINSLLPWKFNSEKSPKSPLKAPLKLSVSLFIAIPLLIGCNKSLTESDSVNNSAIDSENKKPNIVILYVDDLGYGDLSSYGMKSINTPNVDKLAAEGIRFTDAHSSAATCTPSRYSLLTGQYAFRNNAAILPGDAPLIIDPEIPTLPKMLKKAGYATAVVGKWHLGLGRGQVDWNKAVKPGPLEIGFDYSFLMPATGDRVPTVYLENHHVVGLDPNDPITISYEAKVGNRPVGTERPDLLKQKADLQHSATIVNGISRIGWMKGGKSAEWVDEDFPHVFTEKAIDWMTEHKDEPFMLFFPFHDIHVPRVPNEMFQGKSPMGVRGDAILQMDWMTGQIVNHLKELGIYDNTIIIYSSDNGPVLDDGYFDQADTLVGDHDPSGGFRGGKYSAYEAGTRVPMIVTYPNGMKKAGVSDALFSHIDLYKSLAELAGVALAKDEAIDSTNLLATLLDATADGRDEMLEEAFTLSLRSGKWKYIQPATKPTPDWLANKHAIENGLSAKPQLFDISVDQLEQNNIAAQYPDIVKQLDNKIEAIKNIK